MAKRKTKAPEAPPEQPEGVLDTQPVDDIGAPVEAPAVEAPEAIGGNSVAEVAPEVVQVGGKAGQHTGHGDTVIVKHNGQEHEAVCTGFTMGMKARLKDGKDTEVFVAHGDWRPKE